MSADRLLLADAYQQAVDLTRRGEQPKAEAICREILLRQPGHTNALLLVGVIEMQSGRAGQAAASFENSIRIDPSQPMAHALLGDALLVLRRPQEALDNFERALQTDPRLIPAHFGRGNALVVLERPLDALASYESVLRLEPQHSEALCRRGDILLRQKDYAAALESYDRAIALHPSDADTLSNRGGALRALGRARMALESYDAALRLRGDFVEALCGRGDALLDLQRPEEALAAYDRAIRLRPDFSNAHNGRGNCLCALRRFEDAVLCFDEALRLDSDNAAAIYNRGNAMLGMGQRAAALASFERAILQQPGFTDAMRSRGDLLLALQQPEAATECFAALLQADPDFENTPGALLHAKQCCADWSVIAPAASRDGVHQAVLAGKRADSPFSFLSVADSPAAQLRCAKTFVANRWPPATPLWTGERYGNARIRVAYVSGDFRAHAVSYLMAGVFERHDRERFEVFGFSLRGEEQSPMGRRVKGAFDRFVDLSALSDDAAARLMHSLQIGIAVDLVGFTDGLRPGIFARRPAPIQVNYLGFPGTLGASYMDYILADAFVIPAEQAHHYSERVAYLPDCFQANDDQRTIGERAATRSGAGLPDKAFVFCCFNNGYKLNPAMFDIWMRLLDRVPASLLWLLGAGDTVSRNLRREALRRGVDPERLVFAARLPYAEHLRRLELADLFLDTLPFNAGTTASDALWAGLPVLTCAGESFAARMAGSIVRAAGLPELVTPSLADYEAKALELALEPEMLRELRRRLGESRRSASVFDTESCRRRIESAYDRMWQRYLGGEAPQSFAV